MGILRKTFQREVFDILDSSVFTASDFEVSFGDSEQNEFLIMIKFISNPEYIYGIYRSSAGGNWVRRKPGDFENEDEKGPYSKLSDTLIGIPDWCEEVRNELKASQPLYSEIDKLREIIEEHIKGKNSDDEFSVEEISILRNKLEQLEKRVVNLEKDKVITETQLEEFKAGMNQVKEDLEYYPKKTWIRTASNKLLHIVMAIGKSKEGRRLLEDGAKKLIGLDQ